MSLEEARGQLHDVIRKDIPFDEKVREALDIGAECLDADQGFLTRIDQATDHWEVVVTTDTEDPEITPGEAQHLQDTYCRETISDPTPKELHNAPDQGWSDDPAFETSELHTYIGIPLLIDEDPYGTICFVADDPRSEPFSEAETRFAEHLTRLLERELARDRVEADLTSQTNLAAVLNRVIRHNLRNDVSVIRGYTDLVAEQIEDEDRIETIRSHVNDLINLSEKTRELERIITSEADKQPTPVVQLVEDIVEELEQEHPNASISVEYDQKVSAPLRPSFDRAIIELVENAIVASGEDGTVSVTVDTVPNEVEIRIEDDGPGLPEQEAEVLNTGVETSLSHGSGLGLWLTRWIVTQHDGSISPSMSHDGTTIAITIPRIPSPGIQQELTEVTRGRDRYQAAFEAAYEAIIVLNDDAHILTANPAASDIFGLDSDALLGQSLEKFLPDEFDFDADWADFQEVGRTRGTMPINRADGVERNVEYSATADIVPGEHLMVARDITERRERERELKRYEAYLQESNDIVTVLDESGAIQYQSPAAERVLGYDPAGMEGQNAFDFVHPEDREAALETFNELLAEPGETVTFEGRFRTADDAWRWLDVRATNRLDRDPINGVVINNRDITERKEREQEIRELNQQLQGILDTAEAQIYLKGLEGEYLRINQYFRDMFGIDDDEDVIGMTDVDLFPEDVAAQFQADDKQVIEQNEPIETEEEVPTKDGIRTFLTRKAPISDEDGNTYALVGLSYDITERKERERELQETKQRLKLALEGTGTGVWEWEIGSDKVVWNESMERLFGLEPGTFEGTYGAFKKRIHPDDREDVEEAIEAKVESDEAFHLESRLQRPDGEQRWVDARAEVFADEEGSERMIGVVNDITERKEREREVEALKERYQTLLDAAPDPVFVADGETGEIIEANEAAGNLLGESRDEIVGRHQSELHPSDKPDLYRQLFEEHVQSEDLRRTLPDGSPIHVVTADRDNIPVEINVDTVSLPEGSVVFGIFRDISEREDREEGGRESRI